MWINILLFLWAGSGVGQGFDALRFSHVTDKDGLSNNHVNAITQDDDGIIWFATQNGLDRFDGYGCKVFYAQPGDPHSIPSSIVSFIIPDGRKQLWGSTSQGIFCLNTRTQHTLVFTSDTADKSTFVNSSRPNIILDSLKLPWVVTDEGLYHFKDSVRYKREAQVLQGQPGGAVFGPWIVDKRGQWWSCSGDAVYKLDNRTKRVIQTLRCPAATIIQTLVFDDHGRCWVCTWGKGLYLLDTERNVWRRFCPSKSGAVVYGGTEWILDGQAYLVFACDLPGLLFVNERDTSTYTRLFDASSLMMSGTPFVDRQNILWVPTTDGVYYTTPADNLFSVIPVVRPPDSPVSQRLLYVYNMREDVSGYWVSKRYNGGVFWYDKHWKLIRSWSRIPVRPNKKFQDLSRPEAFDFRQRDGFMYVTTEAGISVLNLGTGRWSDYTPADAQTPPRLRTILPGEDHTWWIRSFDHGVYIFDPATRRFIKHYGVDTGRYSLPAEVNYILQDKAGRVFATTNAGLFEYKAGQDRFEKVSFLSGPTPSKALMGMTEDAGGLIWIGAENGLFAYNPATHQMVRTFRENNELGIVFRLCTDREGNIWVNSNNGYWCWLRKRDQLVRFDYALGLPRNNEGCMYEATDGFVYAGGKNALVRFSPERLANYRGAAGARIIEAMVHDTLAPFVLNASGERELILSPEDNSLHVDFDVINYDLPTTNQFFYRLSPGDQEWNRSETGHLAFYSLQPGGYRLEVRGGNQFTGNVTPADSLLIVVKPYWYQSTWFKVLCALASVLVITYIAWYRIRMVRKEAVFQQKIAEIEMTALRAQMNPHFIFNSLNSIENFIMRNEKRLASDYLNKFATLIRSILENSRTPLVPVAKDMEAMELYVDLEKVRFEDKFRFITEVDDALINGDYRVAPLLIQPFIENAIIHGIAPSDRKDLYLRVAVRLQDDYIQYTIEDNGIGRVASMVYTGKRRTQHKSLGIQISRERIHMINRRHGADGTLDIVDLEDADRAPAGTRIILTIKIT